MTTEIDLINGQLAVYAKTFEELSTVRIATGNRIRQLVAMNFDTGKEYERVLNLFAEVGKVEHEAELSMNAVMRHHPLHPWVKAQKGVGDKTTARLLAIIGNPADRQHPSQLWAYCGYHVVDGQAPRRQKGVLANWNTDAKTLVYLTVEAMVKAGVRVNDDAPDKAPFSPETRHAISPWGQLYLDSRAKYADAVHSHDCPRCGVCDGCGKAPGKGKQEHLEETGCNDRRIRPALAGDPLKPSHQNARAFRIVGKRFLLEMWREARRLEGHTDDLDMPVAA